MERTNTPHGADYSYFQTQFVSFYDQMVQECYGGTSARDVQAYATLLQQHMEAAAAHGRDMVVVDLGCGSGRASLAILERLALTQQPPCKLHLFGVDNSAVFLEAARAKCSAFLDQHTGLQQWISTTWVLGSFEDWDLPQQAGQLSATQQHTKADVILVAGAGLHHVTSTAGVRVTLQRAAQRLAPDGICVISYLPWAELYRQDNTSTSTGTGAAVDSAHISASGTGIPSSSTRAAGAPASSPAGISTEVFRVRGYKRVLLNRAVHHRDDGSCVLTERFALSKLAEDDEAREEWRIEEGWELRRLEVEELLALAADAGLQLCQEQHSGGVSRCLQHDLGGAQGEVEEEEHGSHFVLLQHKRQ